MFLLLTSLLVVGAVASSMRSQVSTQQGGAVEQLPSFRQLRETSRDGLKTCSDGQMPKCTSDYYPQQPIFGDGSDGSLLVDERQTVTVNRYAYVKRAVEESMTSMVVSSTSGFAVGSEICILQTKGNNTGRSVFATVTSADIEKSLLKISTPLPFRCSSEGSVDRCQVVTVPHYTNVTLKQGAEIRGRIWDGSTGGVIVFRASHYVDIGSVTSKIDACGLGFRGGNYGKSLRQNGFQGESYSGTQERSSGNNHGGGGGGVYKVNTYRCSNRGSGGGGAGGAHNKSGTAPSRTTCAGTSTPGVAYGDYLVREKFLMGSGGGGGARDEKCCGLPGRGGRGGGIVVILSPVIMGSGGQITACGENGQSVGHNLFRYGGDVGAGGGGAGGSILLVTRVIKDDGSVSLNVDGGAGGKMSTASYSQGGGDGASGKYMIFIPYGPLFGF